MDEIKKALLAPCGLYCGLCRIYIAYRNNDREFKKEILPTLNSYGVKIVDEITCTGCLSKGIIFHFCQNCPIKDCTKNKNFDGCFQCDDFPCTIITNWPDSLKKKSCSVLFLPGVGSERKNGSKQRKIDINALSVELNCFTEQENA